MNGFTLSQLANAIGAAPARVRRLIGDPAPGQSGAAPGGPFWHLADLPPDIRERLATRAEALGFENPHSLILSLAEQWRPELALARICPGQVAAARTRQRLLAPILRKHSATASVSDLVAAALRAAVPDPQFPICSDRTFARWIQTAIARDRGRCEWERVELYLDAGVRPAGGGRGTGRQIEPEAGIDHAGLIGALAAIRNPLEPSLEESRGAWMAAIEEMDALRAAGWPDKKSSGAVLRIIEKSGVRLARSRDGLRKRFKERWTRWCTEGPAFKDDRRQENKGRAPEILLNAEELRAAKAIYIQNGSKTMTFRLLANSPVCRDEVADVILRPRSSKHKIPPAMLRQLDIPDAVKNYHKSPKNVRVNSFICPRTLTYLDRAGVEQRLMPGDLFERDDMSNNFLCWIPWPWGGDPCSDRYGVRIARGQNLLMIDAASLFFASFNFLIRIRDSYRADDIWAWVGDSYRDPLIGMPRIGERWEGGTWTSRKLRGDRTAPIEEGHTGESAREGGMSALGLRVVRSWSPTTKIIENRFNFLQTACATIKGQIGRRRGEMERVNKLWTHCKMGYRDPREYFLSFDDACDQIEAKLHFVNGEPVEGVVYAGIPARLWEEGIKENPLRKLAEDQGYLFARDKRVLTVAREHVRARFTRPDGSHGMWWFHSPALRDLDGVKVAVYFDTYNAEAGATLVASEGRDAGKVLGHADLIEGCPQFAMGADGVTDRDAINRKREFMDAVQSEYRSLGLGGKSGGRRRLTDDGKGRSLVVTRPANGSAGATIQRSDPADDLMRRARELEKSRGSVKPDLAQIERIEREFMENGGLCQ